ncbi:molybdenum cofactor biosynthesis protein [Trametes punicea]|nr:molybdenum cofactor biosynthesis protein [Trametes punicea]
MSGVRVAILTVSDTAAADASADRSGPTVQSILTKNGYICKHLVIVPDDEIRIRTVVLAWCDQGDVDWIITTGGTGFGLRDRTPEAIKPLLEREAPGLVHLLLSASLQSTPLAALSRPVAGTIRHTLIVTLPGSVKAVQENLAALLNAGVVNHAIELVRGGSGRAVHAQLAAEGVRIPSVTPNLRGHVIAEDVYAPQNVPVAPSTNVDGYALRCADHTHTLALYASSPGHVFRVNTGGPLPAGADAVIMVEDTRLHSTQRTPTGEEFEEDEIETLVQVPRGENVREPGSDVKRGELVLERGTIVNSAGGEIGTLAFVGRTKVNVIRKPVVALLSTGNELLDLQSPHPLPGDGWGGIWDTNRPSLQAAIEGLGYGTIDLGIIPDNLEAHVAVLRKGLESADILLTTGGTSMGVGDLLKPVIERHLNGTIHFGRVSVKPGKPTTFATIPTPGGRSARVPIFALPGNPASALVMFHVFVIPALRKLGGWPELKCRLPSVRVQIQESMRLDPRPEYHRAIIKASPAGFKAYSTGGQRSSRVASLKGANGLIALPARTDKGPSKLEIGDFVEAIIIGELQMEQ